MQYTTACPAPKPCPYGSLANPDRTLNSPSSGLLSGLRKPEPDGFSRAITDGIVTEQEPGLLSGFVFSLSAVRYSPTGAVMFQVPQRLFSSKPRQLILS